MPDDLRKIYEAEGLAQFYFDDVVPCDLYRGQSRVEAKQGLPVLYPHPGYVTKSGRERKPDVEIVERDGKQIVKGCRCTSGDYRGISVFDRRNQNLLGFQWFKLPKSTEIPEALAITQDEDRRDAPNHFTIAPKDDMPLPLFRVWLNALARHMTEEK